MKNENVIIVVIILDFYSYNVATVTKKQNFNRIVPVWLYKVGIIYVTIQHTGASLF